MTQKQTPDRGEQREETIEAQIGETRSVIGEDLHAIGEKPSAENLRREAGHLADEAKSKVKETIKETAGEVKDAAVGKMRETKDRVVEKVHDVRDSAVETASHAGEITMSFVRENAVPLSLIGLGVAWMIASNRRRAARDSWMRPSRRELGHELEQRARHGLQSGMEHARDVGHKAREGLHRAEIRSRDFVMDNPLVIGAAAVAAGVGVGMLLPSTDKEDELIGGTRDRLLDEARRGVDEIGRGVKETTREVRSALQSPPR